VIAQFIPEKQVNLGGSIYQLYLMFYATIHFMIGSSLKRLHKETIFHFAEILVLDWPSMMEL